jgi:glycosyltransferase involved in cell wall biosynthesis
MRCPTWSELPSPLSGKTGWPWTEESQQLPDTMADGSPWPLVSIVTPSFNQGQYIEETIRSVLLQGYPNLEYIIIDGGSTDGSVETIRKYEPWLAYWVSEPDQGQAEAINKGLLYASGEVVAWLNSDDTYLPDAVTRQVSALVSHPQAGVVYGQARFTDEAGQECGRYHSRPFNQRRFLHLSLVPQPTVFFRRQLVDVCGMLDTTLYFAIDYEFFLRVMWETELLYNNVPIATYRLHSASKTRQAYRRMMSEVIPLVQRVCDQHALALSGVKRKAVSDWYWVGAMLSLEAGDREGVWRYGWAACRAFPLRPRMLMFGLKVLDTWFHTRSSEIASDWLDMVAGKSSLRV